MKKLIAIFFLLLASHASAQVIYTIDEIEQVYKNNGDPVTFTFNFRLEHSGGATSGNYKVFWNINKNGNSVGFNVYNEAGTKLFGNASMPESGSSTVSGNLPHRVVVNTIISDTPSGIYTNFTYYFNAPDPCGPVEFETVIENNTQGDRAFAVILYEEGEDPVFLDRITLGPYSKRPYSFYAEELCGTVRVEHLVDGDGYRQVIETHQPDAPNPTDPPEDPPLPEDPEEDLPFEETEPGEIANDETKTDVEKLIESDVVLWRGTDKRLAAIEEALYDIRDQGGSSGGGTFDDSNIVAAVEEGNGKLDTIAGKIDEGNADLKRIADELEEQEAEAEAAAQEDFAARGDGLRAAAEGFVQDIGIPEVVVATQTEIGANGGWPVFSLPGVGTVNTNPYTRFPAINEYGAICRNVILVLIWLLFVRKASSHLDKYVVGIMQVPGTSVGVGLENQVPGAVYGKLVAKAAIVAAAIVVCCTALVVLLEVRLAGSGAGGIIGIFGTDTGAMLGQLGPVAGLIDTFIPIAPMLFFMMLGIAFPFLCLPIFLVASFIVKLVPI